MIYEKVNAKFWRCATFGKQFFILMPWSTVNNNDNNNNNMTIITLEIKAFFQTLHISKFCIKNLFIRDLAQLRFRPFEIFCLFRTLSDS